MGKAGRGALWLLFPPAGAIASYRAGRRKDVDRLVEAIQKSSGSNGHSTPEKDEDGHGTAAAVIAGLIIGGYWLVRGISAAAGPTLAILGLTALVCGAIVVAVWLADRRRG